MGHSGAGKSTLAETMIYESGNLSKRGTIETGTTLSDYRPIEKEKGKSVSSTLLHLDWRGTKVNLLDNPGTADFSGRSEEHTSELQSRGHLVCRLLLEKKKQKTDVLL